MARTNVRPFRMLSALALCMTAVALLGCTSSVPAETPGITGSITYAALNQTPPPLASITVEGGPQPDGAVSDKAVVAVTEKTAVFDAEGGRTDVTALRVGQQVKVWFTGPVAESYPVQGAASAIQITGALAK